MWGVKTFDVISRAPCLVEFKGETFWGVEDLLGRQLFSFDTSFD